MKYRILENQEKNHAVQYQYKFWPFWFWLTSDSGANNEPIIMIFKTLDEAISYIAKERAEREKPKWKVVW